MTTTKAPSRPLSLVTKADGRPLRLVTKADGRPLRLVGVGEIAELMGVSRATASARLKQHPQAPAPLADLYAGPVYDLDDVEPFLAVKRTVGRPLKTASP